MLHKVCDKISFQQKADCMPRCIPHLVHPCIDGCCFLLLYHKRLYYEEEYQSPWILLSVHFKYLEERLLNHMVHLLQCLQHFTALPLDIRVQLSLNPHQNLFHSATMIEAMQLAMLWHLTIVLVCIPSVASVVMLLLHRIAQLHLVLKEKKSSGFSLIRLFLNLVVGML